MPIILVLLVIVFGSVVAALLPLAIGAIAVLGTFAELSVLGSLTDVSVFSINLTTALGLGLAIDYALLMVNRFREELAGGRDTHDAVVRTVETAGRTIMFSALTVAVALAALLVFPLYFLRSFAYAGVGVVIIAMVGAIVVLPALLAVLGHEGQLAAAAVGEADAELGVGGVGAGSPGVAMRRPVLRRRARGRSCSCCAAIPLLRVRVRHAGRPGADHRVGDPGRSATCCGRASRTTTARPCRWSPARPANVTGDYADAAVRGCPASSR